MPTTPIMDRGFFITLQAVHRQLAAMPSELYLVRLIHHHTRKPFPAEPLWTGWQLSRGGTVKFLRLRNRQGFDVYLRPYAEKQNAGYDRHDARQWTRTLCGAPDQPRSSPGLGSHQQHPARPLAAT